MGLISGSLGITGSATLNMQMQITGSTISVSVTGSIIISQPSILESGSLISISGGSATRLVTAIAGKRLYIYTSGYSVFNPGVHYFYFGTSTTPTSKIFLTSSGSGVYQQTFNHPRISSTGDGVYIYSDIGETSIPCDVSYVQS